MPTPDNNAGTWLASELLSDVRQKARIPAGTLDYTDAILLEEATRAIWSFAGWAMAKSRDGRLLSMLDKGSSSFWNTTYAQNRECDLPWDAVGDTIDSVVWVDSGGNESRLEIIDEASQPLYDSPTSQTVYPWGYTLVGGRLRLYPKPQVAGRVRIVYQRRLPRLVLPTGIHQNITASTITATNFTVTHSGTPALAQGDRFDVIQSAYPYRYQVENAAVLSVGPPITSSTYNQNTLWIGTTSANSFANQTLVLSGSSPYVHLPLEFKQALTQKIAAQVLGDIGDMTGSQALEQRAETELVRVLEAMNPRAQSNKVKVVNPFSLMRTRRWGRWGF